MIEISSLELRNNLSLVLKRANQGEVFVVLHGHQKMPLATISPVPERAEPENEPVEKRCTEA